MNNAPRRVFNILSIDGGGIKGLYTAAMLHQLELAMQRRFLQQHGGAGTPPRLNQCFDLIAGTSTGAIIACGLACGKSTEEILTLYRTLGQKIFPDTWWLPRMARSLRQSLLGARYSHYALRECLHDFLPGRRFSSTENYLLLPVTNMVNYSPRIFKTRHGKYNNDQNDLLADIAIASASAPTYFPLTRAPDVKNGLYADGGLFANNPTMVALIEALWIFVGPTSERNEFDEVAILSLGNYGSPQGFRTAWFGQGQEVNRDKSMLGWMLPQCDNNPLLSALMDAQMSSTRFSIGILKKCLPMFTRYCRIDASSGKARATPQARLTSFALADARTRALTDLEGFGMQDGQTDATDPEVCAFFDSVRAPIRCYYPTQP